MKKLLTFYEQALGQRINRDKTGLFFSRNTPLEDKQKILDVARIPVTQRFDKYLGFPALVGKSRTKEFQSILDKVWKRLQDRKIKLLS
jgi:hypothetical protein